jgi:hypothetical protein
VANDTTTTTTDPIADDVFVLSTIDNPYNPKTQYDEWKSWDEDSGYFTEQYIGRLLEMEGDFDVDDEFTLNNLREKVIQDILENDVINLYILV